MLKSQCFISSSHGALAWKSGLNLSLPDSIQQPVCRCLKWILRPRCSLLSHPLQKATWEMQTSIDKRNTVICQGGLLGGRTGVQSVNTCSADVKNSKGLPRCLLYLRWAASSQPSYRWASKLQSPTQLMAVTPQSPVSLQYREAVFLLSGSD